MFEAWNGRLCDDAGGLMLWMSHPAWYSTVWQTYDYDFDVNGAYYGVRKAAEPIHVQADPVSGQVVAVNHTPRPVTGATVSARLYDLSGHPLSAERHGTVDVPASATADAFSVAWTDALPAFHLLRLRLRLTDRHGEVLSENVYWRYRKPEDMQALNKAAQTRVAADVTDTDLSGGRHGLTARVGNRGASVAALVRLSLVDARRGDRVLPTLYSDNYLWLLPGESRTVTLSWPAGALPSKRPKLRLDGYNVPRTTAQP